MTSLPPRTRPRFRLCLGSLALVATALSLATGCGGADPPVEVAAQSTSPSASREVRKDIVDLIAAVTPLAPDVPVGEQHRWYARRTDLLERLHTAGHAHGLEALRMYEERRSSLIPIRKGLLEIAAFNAPEETRDTLIDLVETYEDDLGLRSRAAELLGAALPKTAVEVLGPILRGQRTGRTYPEADILLQAWNSACKATNQDPIPVICEVAVDMNRATAVRNAATKLLGKTESNQGRQALERILVESGGDQLIRRFAAQALRDTVPQEDFCEIIRRTFEREQDVAFQFYLEDMTLKNCP